MKIEGGCREACEATEFVAPVPHPPNDHVGTSRIKLSISQTKDRRYVTAALMLVMSLASMEMTVTSTAMPTIIGDLHGLEHYSWVASLYLLTSTVSMPLYGRLADKFGRKRVIIAAISIFTGASMLASTSQSMMQLILFRGLQGLGAGGIMPVVLTILSDIFTLKERASVQGLFSAVWGIAAMGGPALGAILVNTLGWRSVFYVNLPLGLLVSSILAVPHWVLTMTLSITGLGLGPASLCYLLAPQEAVSWQQRGNVTSSVMFFRTIGGALGVGMLGALFNVLIASDLARLQRLGIKPSEVFSPELRSKLSPEILASGQHAIIHALTWVFAAMLFFALVQIAVTALMPAFKPQHEIKRFEAV